MVLEYRMPYWHGGRWRCMPHGGDGYDHLFRGGGHVPEADLRGDEVDFSKGEAG